LYFGTVVKQGGVTQAAKELRLSPSTVSTQIHQLEGMAGHKLFDRFGRKLVLESAGDKRLETARIIEEAMAMAGDVKQVFAEGSVEEKRLFIRAFLSGIK